MKKALFYVFFVLAVLCCFMAIVCVCIEDIFGYFVWFPAMMFSMFLIFSVDKQEE